MARKGYQGHPSWALWNVALWFANDESLYRMALDAIRRCRTKDRAAEYLCGALTETGGPMRTPDGARFTKTAIRYALRGLE